MASSLQLVDRTGQFNEHGLEDFVETNELSRCGQSYVVVAIVGPQSSGKSTLLNSLFRTKFVEMDALKGRRQTTQGVWLAKAEGLTTNTLVLDLEGSDGKERGEDDTLFERQSSLFALAVSDILLINIWHHDIGRVNAAGLPLLKTVFAVMVRLLPPRKMTLMFVVRDVSPHEVLARLEVDLMKDLEELWNTVKMPTDHEGARLQEFFDVKVTLLKNYETQSDEFEKQVANLRSRFQNSTGEGGLAGDRSGTVAGTAFSYSSKLLWKKIKMNKDLDLPKHRDMVDTFRCDVIASEKLQCLKSNNEWQTLEQQAQNDVIAGFGRRAGALVKECVDGYMEEAKYHDVGIMKFRLQSLNFEVWNAVRPSYVHQIEHHKDQALRQFKKRFDHCRTTSSRRVSNILPTVRREALDSFDRGCEDAKVAGLECDRFKEEASRSHTEASKMLSDDINTYVQGKREAKLSELTSSSKEYLKDVLHKHTVALLREAGKSASSTGTWPEIRKLCEEQFAITQSKLDDGFDFDLAEDERGMIRKSLEQHGRAVVVDTAEGEVRRASDMIMERFKYAFTHDQNVPRQWASKKYNIPAITRDAKLSTLRLLSTLAAIRLKEENVEGHDGVDDGCLSDLVPEPETKLKFVTGSIARLFSGEKSPQEKCNEALLELSRKTSWRNASERDTLITPLQFKSLWESFERQALNVIGIAIKERAAGVSATRKSIATGAVMTGVVIAVPVVAVVV